MNFNKESFLEDVKKIHLINTNTIPETEVRERLDIFIDYEDNPRFSTALDEICTNVVGRTMFKILMCKLPSEQRLKITDIGPEQSRSRKSLVEQKGSEYSASTHTVKINLNVYNSSGVGISERQYYCMDLKGGIVPKLKSLSGSIFHEFVHCLHHAEDSTRYDRDRSLEDPKDKLWTSKEERRTIAGYITPDTYDPICDNCFNFYNYCIAKEHVKPLVVFKPTIAKAKVIRKIQPRPIAIPQYKPRFGHIGCVKGFEYSDRTLLLFRQKLDFDLAWAQIYA